MKPLTRALIVAALHLAIICSLGAKLLYDRAARPRVWIETENYDPDLPIRGRYVALRPVLQVVPAPVLSDKDKYDWANARLELRDGKLIAVRDENGPVRIDSWLRDGLTITRANIQLLYFIPEHAKDPTRLQTGQQLWVEATIPKKGPPRPIRLGIKENGKLTPLDLR